MDGTMYISLVPASFPSGTEVIIIGFENSTDSRARPELDDQSPLPTEVRGVLLDPKFAIPTSRWMPSKVEVSCPRGVGDLQCVVGVRRLGSESPYRKGLRCHGRVIFHNDFTPGHCNGGGWVVVERLLIYVKTKVFCFRQRVIGQE